MLGLFQVSEEENTHLETLENYSNLLNYFGDRNALNRETTQTYFDESGKPRKWYRQKSNLRVMGYIDNDRQLLDILEMIFKMRCLARLLITKRSYWSYPRTLTMKRLRSLKNALTQFTPKDKTY